MVYICLRHFSNVSTETQPRNQTITPARDSGETEANMLNLKVLQPATFACGRTCTPGHACRFTPVLSAIGPVTVMSHTSRIEVQIRYREPLAAAVLAMGGTVIGEGQHRLYSSVEEGFAVKLPGWTYPVILRPDNTMAYDNYNGRWGKEDDITTMTERYAVETARLAAASQGWATMDNPDGSLTVSHPSGGAMTVRPDGTVDAVGFIGDQCNVAHVIENAMGTTTGRDDKPEFFLQGSTFTTI